VGSIFVTDPATAGGEVELISEIDGHSRYCVIGSVTERATSRAPCAAFLAALTRFRSPQTVSVRGPAVGSRRFRTTRRSEHMVTGRLPQIPQTTGTADGDRDLSVHASQPAGPTRTPAADVTVGPCGDQQAQDPSRLHDVRARGCTPPLLLDSCERRGPALRSIGDK
jgi:hypothetical protein